MLFSALCIDAKGSRKAVVATNPIVQPEPEPKPVIRQHREQKPTTFKSLMIFVKNSKLAWDNINKRLDSTFVNSMINLVQQAQLEDTHLQALLQTARDVHGVFSNNSDENLEILEDVGSQIAAAIHKL